MPKFIVSRSIQIDADPTTVYERLIDFNTWPVWSPWLLCEKDCQLTFSDDTHSIGGNYSWDGKVVGAGKMTHVRLTPPGAAEGTIEDQLQFLRPWKSESDVSFRIRPRKNGSGSDSTDLTWNMSGSLPLMLFWMKGMMVSMISMDYDRGLKMLKEWIETGTIQSETEVKGITQIGPRRVVGLSGHTTLAEIGPSMEKTIGKVKEILQRAGIEPEGPWISIYNKMSPKTQEVWYTSGLSLPESTPVPEGLLSSTIPSSQALQVSHTGSYSHLGNAWAAAYQNLQASKRKAAKTPAFEIYENNVEDTEEKDLLTQVYLPLK